MFTHHSFLQQALVASVLTRESAFAEMDTLGSCALTEVS